MRRGVILVWIWAGLWAVMVCLAAEEQSTEQSFQAQSPAQSETEGTPPAEPEAPPAEQPALEEAPPRAPAQQPAAPAPAEQAAAPAENPAPEKGPALSPKERMKKVVSLSFTGADLRNVLTGLAKTYGLNIIADDKVKGTVNLTLKSVTLEDAIREILKLNGYTFVWEGSILKVTTQEEEVVTELIPLNFIQADMAMEFLKKEASPTGFMKSDETQNGILITDRASKLEEMKKVLSKIDLPPQQVLIQARLLDITHTDLDNLGFKLSNATFNFNPSGPNVEDQILKFASGALTLPGPSSDLTTDTGTVAVTKGSNTVTATIEALIRNKRVKVLASPTVSTLNNVQAKITIGEKFPIKETTQTTTGTLQTTRFVDVGITLRVTPRINRAGFIQMQIHPEVSSVSATLTEGPRITTREADTTVVVRDRESVIIAGLVKQEDTRIKDRIPILGSIPLLGRVFQASSKTYEQKELVIVITPYLVPTVPPHVARASEVEEVRQRLDATELFQEAEDFEFAISLQARQTPRMIRLKKAAQLYEKVAADFPDFLFTPRSLWRAGELQWQHLKDPHHADFLYRRLWTRYPGHPYADLARRRSKEILRLHGIASRRAGKSPAGSEEE
ncbi:MAG: secretin and TonB N-terminal domain-containing protein [Candidatus Omnitrophica bacterium]|nr:secretin and TonB N-terminal domain-containing protein [Candidatus Omnitrophota bacterium]